jgi:methyl-accepting chemotaxis protein WspA
MGLTFRRKIILLTVCAVIVPVLLIQILTYNMQIGIASAAEVELDKLSVMNIEQIAREAYSICETSNEMLSDKNKIALSLLKDKISNSGGLNLSKEIIEWNAVNQFSRKPSQIKIPKMLLGNQWFGIINNFNKKTLLIDDVTNIAGGTVTIFQRINESGDMIRVATTVKDSNGNRAIGTFIPSTNPDGTKNQVINSILNGKIYTGMAFVVNDWYVTTYEPLYDKSNKLIGMIYVGEKLATIETLRKALMNIKVGKTGYVFIIGTIEPSKGRYILSKDGLRDNEYIWDITDDNGNKVIQEMVNNGLKLKGKDIFSYHYKWRNSTDSVTRDKIAAISYFKQWGWIIGAGTYEDDYYDAKNRINQIIGDLLNKLLIIGFFVLIISIIASALISNKMSAPLLFVTNLATKIAEGNLFEAKNLIAIYKGKIKKKNRNINKVKDDHLKLFFSFESMVLKLDSLIGQVQKSGIQVTTSVTQIAASARELEATVAEQAASTREVTATSNEISSTAQNLAHSIVEVADNVNGTSRIAESGRTNLSMMERAMSDLAKATASITAKLSVINEKANKISVVVTTINKISDQTNLLSLNAAIEAEKAGEYGRGFSVVAREISRLADQTAVATKDIEYMVNEMQSSVSSGVMEMDKFGQEVKKNTEDVGAMGDNLTLIIDKVKSLIPEFDLVNKNTQYQADSAGQISEAMQQLAFASEQTKSSLTEFKQASQQLNEAVMGLQSEVSKFKLS